jgi:hypothetical protein
MTEVPAPFSIPLAKTNSSKLGGNSQKLILLSLGNQNPFSFQYPTLSGYSPTRGRLFLAIHTLEIGPAKRGTREE